jgi:hypothetical protein
MTPNEEIINQRLAILYNALFHCSEFQFVGRGYIFSLGERILINQERGALLSQLTNDPEAGIRFYSVPNELEDRIQYIHKNLE